MKSYFRSKARGKKYILKCIYAKYQGDSLNRDDVEIGGCVEVIRGKHKGKTGIVEDFVADDYTAVR
jgi:hypothetical protein